MEEFRIEENKKRVREYAGITRGGNGSQDTEEFYYRKKD